ncbi:MAG: 2-succinyl-5-enolpyruvyl-6-hydroxy-3-cyclohexene-1-carboxylic-acid synthase [Flavobacterium sp. BFFFF2]|nr:MAG: 2-succinyl-5-enolpyruvyl-6-hydroxy-3-cyclohexene-1-carboxylic-acid synthase [Flavobacterium sp. BFFFF2]
MKVFIPEIPLAQRLIEQCKIAQIRHIVVSPGSRNAPLTLGFSTDPFFSCYSIVDERCAAFFALGMAQQMREPVAVLCTSGSALLNYYPAVAEAFYSQIPLVVISADRPLSKIDIGDGQTIRQRNVFAQHTVFDANLTEIDGVENTQLMQAAFQASVSQRGPIHINIPFEEPLYGSVDKMTIGPINLPTITAEPIPSPDWDALQSIWSQKTKIMVLVGTYFPGDFPAELFNRLVSLPQVLVLTEVTANLPHVHTIASIDTLITPLSTDEQAEIAPDLLITFGGMVVSKRIKALLRKYKPAAHWHIDPLRAYDTFGCLTQHIVCEAPVFFNYFLPETPATDSQYGPLWQTYYENLLLKRVVFMNQLPYSDLAVFQEIVTYLPRQIQLQIGNSSAIRYAQLFAIDKSHQVFCNRGTSGIDGSSSTALGAAVGQEVPVVLITGDISFFYDSNALWNQYVPATTKIILINNGGGGIFRILPGAQETPAFHQYFETRHQLTAKPLCELYGWKYDHTSNLEELTQLLPNWFNTDGPALLEIFTPTEVNDAVLKDYFKALS